MRDVRLAFHALRFRQSEVRLLDEARERLERFVAALRAREAAGDASTYDRLRTEREMALLDVERARASGELVAARAALAARLGEPDGGSALEAADREVPAVPGSVDEIVAEAVAARPDLRAASRTVARLEEESVAAGRARLPIPTAVVGRKSVDEPGISDDGTIVGVTVSLPIFDGRRPAAAVALAAKESASGARAALAARVESEARAAHARESAARAAWEGWQPQLARASDLSRIASIAYDEGEIGILERIDAARGLLEAFRRGLELEHELFRASIELDFATGREAGR
jgi:outer membrane protein TolC